MTEFMRGFHTEEDLIDIFFRYDATEAFEDK
jgi:hypothetical protein